MSGSQNRFNILIGRPVVDEQTADGSFTGLATFTLAAIPLSVFNRALDLYNVDREHTVWDAWNALRSAEARKDASGPLSPLARAIAEYMSLAGPWSEEDGEYAGESGYQIQMPRVEG